jgi:hypothetical protein
MATQSRVRAVLLGWRVRIALVGFWVAMIGWTGVQMITGEPDRYPREHLGMLLGEAGGLLMSISFYLRGLDRAAGRVEGKWLSVAIALNFAALALVMAAFIVSAGGH